MLFPNGTTAQNIATLIGAEVLGNGAATIGGINEIHKVQPGDVVFVDHPKYYDKCLNSVAQFIIINSKDVQVPPGKTLLFTKEPFEAYLKIVRHYQPFKAADKMVAENALIGERTVIMPGAFIGNNVTIGSNCIIHPNVSIYNYTTIGDNVIIHSGTTIGADAFYYNIKKTREVWAKKMESCGHVIIEDDVEIGANCCIDKGVTHNTVIGRGTKMDNLIQIGHDVTIGKNCIIASQVGIAGATTVGDGVTLWGQVGVNKTIHIGDGAVVLGQSGVTASLAANKTYMGYPAEDAAIKRRELVWLKRIPALWKKVMND